MQVIRLQCSGFRSARRLFDKCQSLHLESMLRLSTRLTDCTCRWLKSDQNLKNSKCTHETTIFSAGESKETESLQPTLQRRIRTNVKHFFSVVFTTNMNRDYFSEEEIASRYIQDDVDVSRWCLVYDNASSAVFQRIVTVTTPLLFFSISLLAVDYWSTDGQFSYAYFQLMANHAAQVGDFIYVPVFGTMLVFCVIMKLLNRSLLRIYIDRQNPQRLRALVAKSGIFRQWVQLNRADITLLPTASTSEDQSIGTLLRLLWFGHVHLAGRPYFLDQSSFRNNSFNSFLLSETSRLPKNLKTIDLEHTRLRNLFKS